MAVQQKSSQAHRTSRSLFLWLGSVVVGLLAFGAALLLPALQPRIVLTLDGIVYDQGMSLHAQRAADAPGPKQPVVVLEIGEPTRDPNVLPAIESPISKLKGPLSFQEYSRVFHARLVQNLTRLGAKVIVFDVLFDDSRPEVDPYFAEAIRKHGKVILAAVDDRSVVKEGSTATVDKTISLNPPNAELRSAAAGYGVVNLPQDADQTIRQFLWWSVGIDEDTLEDRKIPSLGVAAAALYSGVSPAAVIQDEIEPKKTFLGRPIEWLPEPMWRSYTSYIRYFGPRQKVAGPDTVIPYESVIRMDEDAGEMERLRELISGKIVVVGDAAPAGQDIHRVPVISRAAGLQAGEQQQMPGVEVQGHIVQTALTGRYPREVGDTAQVLLVLAVCLLIALLGRILNPGPLVLVGVLFAAGLLWGAIQLLAVQSLVVRPVIAFTGMWLGLLGQITFMHFAERRDRMRVKRQLARHVGSGVADKLAEDEWPDLQGESVEITMLFSDLQGFTTLSETMTSPELCAVLNRYFGDVIFPIVDKYDGSTDKLMGDGMMAYFGWPARHPDHAARAIRCALEMQTALEEWKRLPENDHLPPLRTRVGLHTGVATVGEIGSGSRAEFTVIGDVVNVASRLEGMNKEFGSVILISDATRLSAGDVVPMRPRGVATVRGRKEPMPVFSIDPEEALAAEEKKAAGAAG